MPNGSVAWCIFIATYCMQEFAALTNTRIIAEGIETEEELATLISFDVPYGQGYFIRKPSPSPRVVEPAAMHLACHNFKPGFKSRAGQQGRGRQGALTANAGKEYTHPLLHFLCLHNICAPYRFRALKAVGATCRQTMDAALDHIARYGSNHTEIICTNNHEHAMGRSFPYTEEAGIIEKMELILDNERSVAGYGVYGTPASAAAHAVLELADRKPDLCISGINYGGNLGLSITGSGTLGAAWEASSHDLILT